MKESCEKKITVGFEREPSEVFDEVESVSAQMIRDGWKLENSFIEEGLGYIHLVFIREI